jgi:hypothetical protein
MSFAQTTGPKGRRFQQSSWPPEAAPERRRHRKAVEAKRRSRPKGGLTPTGRRGNGRGRSFKMQARSAIAPTRTGLASRQRRGAIEEGRRAKRAGDRLAAVVRCAASRTTEPARGDRADVASAPLVERALESLRRLRIAGAPRDSASSGV